MFSDERVQVLNWEEPAGIRSSDTAVNSGEFSLSGGVLSLPNLLVHFDSKFGKRCLRVFGPSFYKPKSIFQSICSHIRNLVVSAFEIQLTGGPVHPPNFRNTASS